MLDQVGRCKLNQRNPCRKRLELCASDYNMIQLLSSSDVIFYLRRYNTETFALFDKASKKAKDAAAPGDGSPDDNTAEKAQKAGRCTFGPEINVEYAWG